MGLKCMNCFWFEDGKGGDESTTYGLGLAFKALRQRSYKERGLRAAGLRFMFSVRVWGTIKFQCLGVRVNR